MQRKASIFQRQARVADHSSEQHKDGRTDGQQSDIYKFARTLVLSDPTQGGDKEVKINFRDQATVCCDDPIQADVSLLPRAFFEYYQRNRKDDGDVARALVEMLEDGAPTWLENQPDADKKIEKTTKLQSADGRHWELPGTGLNCSLIQKHSTKISMPPFKWKLIGGLVIVAPLYPESEKDKRRATAEEFLVLACIMLELARDSRGHGILGYGDSSGATPVHNLLLSDDPACLLIAYHMFKVCPELMLQTHEEVQLDSEPSEGYRGRSSRVTVQG